MSRYAGLGCAFFNTCALMPCRKELALGEFSEEECYLRLKRWLVAGLSDSDWPATDSRQYHVSMGGLRLHEFKNGLTSAQLDAAVGHVADA